MIATIKRSKSKPKNAEPVWHAAFLAMLPAIRRQAQICLRKIRPELRQDLIQEVIANCFVAYARLVELGKQDVAFPSALARYALAQVRTGRRVGNRLRIRDVMSRYAQHQKGFQVEPIYYFDEEEECWQEILVEDKRATPAEIAACRLDFSAWLSLLPKGRRKVAMVLAAGETTNATAKKFGVTPGRISQLRQWLRASWEAFQGDAKADETMQLAAA